MREQKRAASSRISWAVVSAGLSSLLAVVLVWAGCLPDLTPIPPDAGPESGTIAPQNVCGDGIIATLDDGGDAGESCDPGDAAVIGCRSCRIDCSEQGGVVGSGGHCYFALAKTSIYKDASELCRAQNAHVATLATPDEVTLISGLAKGQPYWVGLSFDPVLAGFQAAVTSEPGFPGGTSGPCEGCFGVAGDGGVFLPETDSGFEFCVVARDASGWRTRNCTDPSESFATICEREPEGKRTTSCIGGFCFNVVRTAGQKTYLLGVDTLTASEADATCKSLDDQGEAGPGTGRLAVFATTAEREEIAREIVRLYPPEAKEESYWIGLVTSDAGSWTWEDGEPVSDASTRAAPWGDKQPFAFEAGVRARAYMRIAVTYDTQLAYGDDSTSTRRRYICERKPTP